MHETTKEEPIAYWPKFRKLMSAIFPQSSRCPLTLKLTFIKSSAMCLYRRLRQSLNLEFKIEVPDKFDGDPRQARVKEYLPGLGIKPRFPPISSYTISSDFPR